MPTKAYNPAALDPGSADYVLGEVSSFGLIDSTGKVVKAVKGDTNHNAVAHRLGFKHTTDALRRGNCIRFLVSLNGNAGFSYWADKNANKDTLTRILKFVESEPSVNGGFDAYNIYDNHWIDGVDYDEAVTALKKAIRTGNPSYHGNVSDGQPVFSWGFISPTGHVSDGATIRSSGINSHDKLAKFESMTSEAKALGKGYVRYLTARMGTSKLEVSATIAEPWAKPALQLWKYLDSGVDGRVPGLLYLDFTEANGKQHYASIAVAGEDKIKNLLTAVGRGEDPADVTERFRRQQYDHVEQNPSYHGTGEPYPWGFLGLKSDHNGLKAGTDVTNHDKLATTLGFKDEEDAMRSGDLIRYFYSRDNYSDGKSLTLYMTMASPKTKQKADRLLKWLSASEVEPNHVVLDVFEYGRRREFTPVLGLAGENNLAHTKGILKRLAAGETVTGDYFNGKVWTGQNPATRNGLHHADSPHNWPQDWDDFTGAPWGFISPTGQIIDGIDADEQIDNHDALALAEKLVPQRSQHPEDDALWKGYARFITYRRDGQWVLGVDASSNKGRDAEVARKILKAIPKLDLPFEQMDVMIFTTNTPYGSQKTVFMASDTLSKVTGALKRIAAGEWPGNVQQEVKVENPYAFSPGVSHFGIVSPDGKLHRAGVNDITHDDIAARLVKHTSTDSPLEMVLDRGYIRYFIEAGGDIYMEARNRSKDTLRAAVKALEQMPHSGEVTIDFTHGEAISARSVKDATVKAKAAMREQNPYAFSKHVTRFGFIKPNAAVVNAKKDELAHQEVAQRLGFPTEHAALSKGGLVRFLVYKDGQSDMEIDTPLDKVAGAIKGFVTKSPDITGVVTLDAPMSVPYWSIHANSPKEFVQRMQARVAGRVQNSSHWAGTGEVSPWGFISPHNKLINGLDYPDSNNHDRLAIEAKIVSSNVKEPETAALVKGYIRYLTQQGSLLMDGVGAAHRTAKTMLSGFQLIPALIVHVQFDIDTGEEFIRYDGTKQKAVTILKQLAAQEKPERQRELVWDRYVNDDKRNPRVAGRVENGTHHTSRSQRRQWVGTPGPWGYFMPDLRTGELKIIDGTKYPDHITNHDQLALAMKMGYSNEKAALADGWVRFLVSNHDDGSIQLLTSISMTTKGKDRDYVKDTLPVIRTFYKKSEIPFTHITFDVLVYGPDSLTPETYSVTTDPPNMDQFIRRVQAGESFRELMSNKQRNPINQEKNSAHWSSGIHASDVPWGLFNKTKIVSGLDTDGVRDHDELAHKIGLHDEENALLHGWVRYIFINDFKGLVLGLTAYHNYPDEMAEIIISQAPKLEMTPELVDLDIREVGGDHVTGRYKGWNKARAVLKRIASGDDLIEIMPHPGESRNPSYSGKSYPFKLRKKSDDLYEVEFADLYKVLVGTTELHGALVWRWQDSNGQQGEARDNMKSVLTDLSLMSDQHTGRLGGAMRFVIYSKTGKILGTVSAPNRAAARDKLRGSLATLKAKVPHDLFLYPYLNSSKEVQQEADTGVRIQ